ncbi:hypothetical protein AB5J72_46795 [Streptomyces sp. CG1]|uniref:hypothetical protein n=1 Tax=Streptomyces sp. CG1 TaxID=1287523 RepID=UPI0034E1A95B
MYGRYAEAAKAARHAVDQCSVLIAEGRDALTAEASRMTGVLATALVCLADIEAAERTLEPAHRRGVDLHGFMLRALGEQHQELRALLVVKPTGLSAQLLVFEGDMRSASGAGAYRSPRDASVLLEQLVGKLSWPASRQNRRLPHPCRRTPAARPRGAVSAGADRTGPGARHPRGLGVGAAALRTLEEQARRHDRRNATRWVQQAHASLTDLAKFGEC